MGEVDERSEGVVPANRVTEKSLLHPRVGIRAEEQESIDVARHLDLEGKSDRVGDASAVVVGQPHDGIEGEVCDHLQLLTSRLGDRTDDECNGDPAEHGKARNGDSVVREGPDEDRSVDNEGKPP